MPKRNPVLETLSRFQGIGGAFFPDQQPRDTWRAYVRHIARLGLSFVRIGEFAWNRMEPEEGEYAFAWLDEIMALLGRHDVRVILCTPTAVPPVWACERYPEIHPVLSDGTVFGFGVRRYTCPTSPAYRRLSEGIAAALGNRYGRNPQVLSWQIDNEIGHPFCFCARCLSGFRAWCARRYGTIENFNDALCTHFLGQTFQHFDQVQFPTSYRHPGMWLAYQRFFSEETIACFGAQVDGLKAAGARQPVTTNFMPTWYGYDHEAMGKRMDYAAGDYYACRAKNPFGEPFERDMFVHAWLQAIKPGRNIWFHEFQWGSSGGVLPLPGETRWAALTQIGRGANAVNFFRVDTCASGMERDSLGLLRVHRKPGRIYPEVRKLARETDRLKPVLDGTRPASAKAAFIFSFPSHVDFARDPKLAAFEGPFGNGYAIHLSRHFRAVVRNNIVCDIVYPQDDFTRYDVLFAPALYVLPRILADRLAAFVAGGGTLVMASFSGVADEHGRVWDVPVPANLSKVFGIEVLDYGAPNARGGPASIRCTTRDFAFDPIATPAWADEVTCTADDIKILAMLHNRYLNNLPVVTCRKHGAGRAVYVGAVVDQAGYNALYGAMVRWLALKPVLATPAGVYVTARLKGRRRVLFVNNPGMESAVVELKRPWYDVLRRREVQGAVRLRPLDVLVLQSAASRRGRSASP